MPVRECFELLAAEADPVFREYDRRSMSIQILNLLGWSSRSEFSADLTWIIVPAA